MSDSGSAADINYLTPNWSARLGSDYALHRFELWFQPVYHLTLGNVFHNEVLLRWRDPQDVLQPPAGFLPAITAANLLSELDRLVIHRVIYLLHRQPQLRLSVNLSPTALEDTTLCGYIRELLVHFQVEPEQLRLELNEAILLQQFTPALQLIRHLKSLGCLVLVDNFIKGELPLYCWCRLPIDAVSIDQQLIQASTTHPETQAFVRAVVQANRALGRLTIAKAVADARMLRAAQACGIDCTQGYYTKAPRDRPSHTLAMVLILVQLIILLVAIVLGFYALKTFLGIDLIPGEHTWDMVTHWFADPLGEH
ncbi:hypothetical protein DO97_19450 [Neosynechococcus sphagnicola sy1]|uniref:EAL domain-containing protein n=1 Tax=Neosynechococcus sphagnicola sy1 TaxID=1497020 RepID=A0A098THB9_9CYAN|nr:EAL domain-containing protein [Neosynechococcus sphagnicola]KGF71479.1 hypothetical protein DO97_19450 [Neosynechococcus sphagnicola sy1]